MNTIQTLLLSIFLIYGSSLGEFGVEGRRHHHKQHRNSDYGIEKLFIFGDSYADTGNLQLQYMRRPYGYTNPGKPDGRFSDGHVFTDFVAEAFGLKSPVPYRLRKHKKGSLHYGMNFAVGGAGVFDYFIPLSNISSQVDRFERLVNKESLYTKYDLQKSMAIVALSGNDYNNYLSNGGTIQGFLKFIPKVVNEFGRNLKRISDLGVKRIGAVSLPPLGCVPELTEPYKFKECNGTGNLISRQHDFYLVDKLTELNNLTLATNYTFVDLFGTFKAIIDQGGYPQQNFKLSTPVLRPCCIGTSPEYSCADFDENEKPAYTVCEHPESTFFWDDVHPTQAAWRAVVAALNPTLMEIASFR